MKKELITIPVFVLVTMFILLSATTIQAQQTVPVKEMKVQSGDLQLFVRIAGNIESGNILFGINGGPGLSSAYFADLEDLAGENLAVITYDQRGCGRSDTPELKLENFTFENQITDIESIRTALDIESFTVLGHSWGGIMAIAYTVSHPEHVENLILIGNAPPTFTELTATFAKIQQRVLALQKEGVIPNPVTKSADMLPAYYSDPAFVPEPMFDLDQKPPVPMMVINSNAGYDFLSGMAEIENHVLILWGKDDPLGLDAAERTKAAMTKADVKLVIIENCGHYWQEQTEAVHKEITEFLASSKK